MKKIKFILMFPYNFLRKIFFSRVEKKYGMITYFNSDKEISILNLIKKIKLETEMLLNYQEAYNIYMLVESLEKVNGEIAEVGVYKGGSAKIILEANKNNKDLFLFDTFEGLPTVDSKKDTVKVFKGQFISIYEDVKKYLNKYSNVYIYKGLFSDNSVYIKNKIFSFVHLDTDLYQSTLDCLIFFYPRMSRGGVIVSHDYLGLPGVRKAFDEFFKDKQEAIIILSRNQCFVSKL